MKIATKDNVRVGDLLRRFHFTGSRRRKHYLYHVVRWNEEEQALEAVPVESIATGERSGSYWICSGVGVGAEVVESLFDHMSEEDYQAKLREIRAVAAQPMGTHAPRKS